LEHSSADLLRIIDAGIDAVRPSILFPTLFRNLPPAVEAWLASSDRYLFSAGKAGADCAVAVLKQASCRDYFVIAPQKANTAGLDPAKVHFGSHPVPDESSRSAAQAALEWLRGLSPHGRLLVVISGGLSALMALPQAGVSLQSKIEVHRLLLRSGASIGEMNAVRKHLSAVKGGRLARMVSGIPTVVLAISDVIGDDFGTIGSGPFYPDHTTFVAARSALEDHGIWNAIPEDARKAIEKGCAEENSAVVSPAPSRHAQATSIPHFVIASNAIACQAAGEEAAKLGYNVELQPEAASGYVENTAERIARLARDKRHGTAVIAGGEVTVRLKGNGTGGRNQHLALLLTPLLAGSQTMFGAAGTDGIDGNSDAAGAWTDGQTAERARRSNLKVEDFIRNFDSYVFFQSLGQSIVTGPTGTNVMDLYILLV
jgi:glycerate 2-kinase